MPGNATEKPDHTAAPTTNISRRKSARFRSVITIALFMFVLLIWGGAWVFAPSQYPQRDEHGNATTQPIQNPGIFGDMFGSVNSLFTGLSLVALTYALILQIEQLREQEEDQRTLRELLSNTVELQAKQADMLAMWGASMAAGNDQGRLQYLIQDLTDRIERLKKSVPTMWGRGSPEDLRRQSLLREIAELESRRDKYRERLENEEAEPK